MFKESSVEEPLKTKVTTVVMLLHGSDIGKQLAEFLKKKGVFVIEVISSFIQIIAIRKFNTKVFLKAPVHHHFEELGWSEQDIVKCFWVAGFLLAMFGVVYGVWL